MLPVISHGDDVVVNQKFKTINKGDIIAFKAENKIFIHRVHNIIEVDGEKFYYTKGDNNKNVDNFKTKLSDIVDVVNIKIPIIGYSTVIFSELQ